MLSNILELETRAVSWWCQLGAGKTGCTFFDIRAAFPSVLHVFILIILKTMGSPEAILHAIAELYRDIKVQIFLCGPRRAFFPCSPW
eukprot:5099591-Pyramimonas_sp.AAC.1